MKELYSFYVYARLVRLKLRKILGKANMEQLEGSMLEWTNDLGPAYHTEWRIEI